MACPPTGSGACYEVSVDLASWGGQVGRPGLGGPPVCSGQLPINLQGQEGPCPGPPSSSRGNQELPLRWLKSRKQSDLTRDTAKQDWESAARPFPGWVNLAGQHSQRLPLLPRAQLQEAGPPPP